MIELSSLSTKQFFSSNVLFLYSVLFFDPSFLAVPTGSGIRFDDEDGDEDADERHSTSD
jgi:hypothetical protein